jgi:hypothetical protein
MILPSDYDPDAIFLFLSSIYPTPFTLDHKLLIPIPFPATSSLRLRYSLFSSRILVPWGCPLYYT